MNLNFPCYLPSKPSQVLSLKLIHNGKLWYRFLVNKTPGFISWEDLFLEFSCILGYEYHWIRIKEN